MREGVLIGITQPGRIRAVTHYGIDRADIDDALERVRHAAAATHDQGVSHSHCCWPRSVDGARRLLRAG